jgi:signal transduction histidine kinase
MRPVRALSVGWLLLAPLPGHAQGTPTPAPIRAGIDASLPPYEFVNDRNEPDGFSVALLRAVAEAEGLEVEFVAGRWQEVRGQIEMGQLDVSAGMVRTPERERFLDFSAPTVLVEHVIFVPVDSPLETLADVREVGVVVQAASIFDDKLQQDYPDVPRQTVATPVEALEAVLEGRAPAAILLHDQGLYLARDRGVEVRSIEGERGGLHYRFAVTAGRSDLLASLNDGLHRVRVDGTYDALYDQWFGVLRPKGLLTSHTRRGLAGAAALMLALLAASLLWTRTLRARVRARTLEVEKRDEEKLELERHLLQSQKMESLGRLAAGVAHDFNNLLSAILGHVHLAEREADPAGRLARALGGIEKAGRSGAELTKQLLAFSRKQDVAPRTLSWNDVIRDSRDILERPLTRRITVHFEPGADLWPVRLDPGQALQILLNLLVNARDAIVSTGNVFIECSNVPGADGDRVLLSVRDDGQGMDDATRERIFEPFFTTKEEGKGTGLGLATVYGIVEQNGGHIEVASRPGEGTRFDILLPRETEPTNG